jgi:hypothetical protein
MLVLASAFAMTAIGAQAQTTQRSFDRNDNCNYSVTTYSDGSTRTTTSTYDQNIIGPDLSPHLLLSLCQFAQPCQSSLALSPTRRCKLKVMLEPLA